MGGNGRGGRTAGQLARRSFGAWLFVYALFALCAVLGILQYRAVTELSIAARERLRSSLEASLAAVSQDFSAAIAAAAGVLTPASPPSAQAAENSFGAMYERAGTAAVARQMFARIAMAVPEEGGARLLIFDENQGVWKPAGWPEEWSGMRARFEHAAQHEGRGRGERPPSVPPGENASAAFDVPLFGPSPGPFPRRDPGRGHGRGGPPESPQFRHEIAWLIFDVSIPYVRSNLLPEILQRHLGADYQAEVVTRGSSHEVIYQSDPGSASGLAGTADDFVSLFDPQIEAGFHRSGPAGMRGPGGPGHGPAPEMGRWTLFVRHRAGSLEAAVAQARWRSMAVDAGVLLMLVATLAALIRYTRRAQRLAGLQMEFVAGVSHELRTPLTVILTAAHNLQGKVAANPAQVERYGALIQQECARLKDLVEQVLQFARANAGRAAHEREPLALETVIDAAIGTHKPVMEAAGWVVEKHVVPDLPRVSGDPVALRQVFENLLANAVKYGSGESRWIGITAVKAGHADQPEVEIRVADRGRGIPKDEQAQIFDPFFRGARAVEAQVHGTGLGLSLVKKIVESHGGNIRLESEPGKGAEFIVRLPAEALPAMEQGALLPATGPSGGKG